MGPLPGDRGDQEEGSGHRQVWRVAVRLWEDTSPAQLHGSSGPAAGSPWAPWFSRHVCCAVLGSPGSQHISTNPHIPRPLLPPQSRTPVCGLPGPARGQPGLRLPGHNATAVPGLLACFVASPLTW